MTAEKDVIKVEGEQIAGGDQGDQGDESLRIDRPVAAAPVKTQPVEKPGVKTPEKPKPIKIPVTMETQFELEILNLEKQACESEVVAAQTRLAKATRLIEFKSQRLLAAFRLQQEALRKSRETDAVPPGELVPPDAPPPA